MEEIGDIITEIGSPTFSKLAYLITAIGALGAAAAALVDATKLFWGGMSNVGFGRISKALDPFKSALAAAVGTNANWRAMMKAHWLNGRPKDEQKAIATSLIRVGLSPDNAAILAKASGVDPTALSKAAASLAAGNPLSEAEVNILGRFNMAIEARLDAAFERADQMYRNASKLLAGVVAVLLTIVAGGVLYVDKVHTTDGYVFSHYFLLAIVIGLIAVPLAPVSKDLVSALGTAVRAMKATKG